MEQKTDLVALADFNLVARHGGFGKAARATGRPKVIKQNRLVCTARRQIKVMPERNIDWVK
ncbi:hypothetical protein QFZ34_001240 [Phyllobacterium ifriqiyense]|uniref:Uncharacterized protein n=1 Tax=Phyllobacterium ifriqiyense TaxID=314238 RepID=A0ABU0S5M9_9HYPH|nr:hypothetical protein [Phyllobacterium ifriqiyense]MDQ0996063.1 hypothetical protein [Phyllobacterium ifriqiyense]